MACWVYTGSSLLGGMFRGMGVPSPLPCTMSCVSLAPGSSLVSFIKCLIINKQTYKMVPWAIWSALVILLSPKSRLWDLYIYKQLIRGTEAARDWNQHLQWATTVLWDWVICLRDLTLSQGRPWNGREATGLMSTRELIGCGINSHAYSVRSIVPIIVN